MENEAKHGACTPTAPIPGTAGAASDEADRWTHEGGSVDTETSRQIGGVR